MAESTHELEEMIVLDPSKVPCCKCKDQFGVSPFAVLRTSNTEKTRGRQFYVCSKPSLTGCKFFAWVEDIIVDSKTGLAKRKYIPASKPVVRANDKAEVEELRFEIAHIKEQLSQQSEDIKRLFEKIEKIENEFSSPPAKSQKTAPADKRAKPKLLP